MRRFAIDLARRMAAAGVLLSAAVHSELWDLQNFGQIDTIAGLRAAGLIWRDRRETAA